MKKNEIMVYSTCTLNYYENEDVLNWEIDNYNIEILPINLGIGLNEKILESKYDKLSKKYLKIIPNKYMEGFFVCKIKKIV